MDSASVSEESVGENFVFDQRYCELGLPQLCVQLERPLRFVESRAFNTFLQSMSPWKPIYTAKMARKDGLALYHKARFHLQSQLKSFSGRVSIASSIWTDGYSSPYLCVSVFWVDEEWKLNKRRISFQRIVDPQNVRIMYKALMDTISRFHLKDKVMNICFDDRSNSTGVVEKLKLGCNSVLDVYFHNKCACHIINVIVGGCLREFRDLIVKLDEKASFFKMTSLTRMLFQACCIIHGKEFGVPLNDVNDIRKTRFPRWSSTYFMLNWALEYRVVFDHYRFDGPYKYETLLDSEWFLADKLCKFLRVFYASVETLFSIEHSTSCLALRSITQVSETLNEYRSDAQLGHIVQVMVKKFVDYWEKIPPIYAIAAALDPRTKPSGAERLMKECLEAMDKLRGLYPESSGEQRNSCYAYPCQLEALYKFYGGLPGMPEPLQELEMYKAAPALDWVQNEKLDVLDWWKSMEGTYPVMAKMAREVLTAQVSAVEMESRFCVNGRVLKYHQSILDKKTLEMCICWKDYIEGPDREGEREEHEKNESREQEGDAEWEDELPELEKWKDYLESGRTS